MKDAGARDGIFARGGWPSPVSGDVAATRRIRSSGAGPRRPAPDHRPGDIGVSDRSSFFDGLGFRLSGRRGHFVMESGLHSDLWLDLDDLFVDSARIAAPVATLAKRLEAHRASIVCGPLIGGAFVAQLLARELGVDFAYTERTSASLADAAADALYCARYDLPPRLVARLRGRRVALVDDVMNAGSSLRAIHDALVAADAIPVVAGVLMVLGRRGDEHFAAHGMPVEALVREPYVAWEPDDCPLCRAGGAAEDVAR